MHFWFLFVHPKRDPPRGGGLHGSIRLAPDQTDRRSRLPQRCAAFWVPDQNAPTRGFLAQARSAANAATAARRTPQEGRQCPPLVRTPPASLVRQSDRALCSEVKATEVWVPDQTSGAQAPYFGGLLGPAVRSAAKAATTLRAASRVRGQRPLPACPSPASWLARPGRALCSGVLRHSPGRVGGVCLDKKQVGAGCDMRVPSTQPKAGTLPGVP